MRIILNRIRKNFTIIHSMVKESPLGVGSHQDMWSQFGLQNKEMKPGGSQTCSDQWQQLTWCLKRSQQMPNLMPWELRLVFSIHMLCFQLKKLLLIFRKKVEIHSKSIVIHVSLPIVFLLLNLRSSAPLLQSGVHLMLCCLQSQEVNLGMIMLHYRYQKI